MDEKQIAGLISNLDDELFCRELDGLIDEMKLEIKMDSIAEKARWKIRKEQQKMRLHKRKVLAVMAACIALMIGATTVYAAEISAFIQSLFGKTAVYSAVVDGEAFYLEAPIALDGNRSLSQVMFTDKELGLQFDSGWDSPPDVKIVINGNEITPHTFGGDFIGVYDLTPTDRFDLILDGKSYPVSLMPSGAVTEGGEIVEAETKPIAWISMGFKKINGGVQILTTFDHADLQLQSLIVPASDKVTESFSGNGSNSRREKPMPLVGYDADGNAYKYEYDAYDMGQPQTKFTSNAPADKPITLKIPGIAVAYQKDFANINVAIPVVGEKQDVNTVIDLSLQRMVLESIERTSATTARLNFKLNTGDDNSVRIWSADVYGANLTGGELLWENGTCTADVTFAEDETQIELQVGWPSFMVDGNWEMLID